MPDLTPQTYWMCVTATDWSTPVEGSKGDQYYVSWGRLGAIRQHSEGVMYGWHCTCKGFRFRSKCKHVEAVKDSGTRCGWFQFTDGLEPVRNGAGERCCPKCASPVEPVRMGV